MASFVKAMCSSEKDHVKLLAGFISKNSALHKAVKDKDWSGIASNYNGADYKNFDYDTKLENAYNEIKRKGKA